MIAERKRQDETLTGTPRGVPGRRDGKDVRLGRWLLCAARRRGLCHAPRRDVRKAKELALLGRGGRGGKARAVITTLRAADAADMAARGRRVHVRTTL